MRKTTKIGPYQTWLNDLLVQVFCLERPFYTAKEYVKGQSNNNKKIDVFFIHQHILQIQHVESVIKRRTFEKRCI